jgi:hypothetical protein
MMVVIYLDGCDLSSDATNTASVDARDDLLYEELDVHTMGNNNDIL